MDMVDDEENVRKDEMVDDVKLTHAQLLRDYLQMVHRYDGMESKWKEVWEDYGKERRMHEWTKQHLNGVIGMNEKFISENKKLTSENETMRGELEETKIQLEEANQKVAELTERHAKLDEKYYLIYDEISKLASIDDKIIEQVTVAAASENKRLRQEYVKMQQACEILAHKLQVDIPKILYEFLKLKSGKERAVLLNGHSWFDTDAQRWCFRLQDFQRYLYSLGEKQHITRGQLSACIKNELNGGTKFVKEGRRGVSMWYVPAHPKV
jgi:chromosome segregation ATPase